MSYYCRVVSTRLSKPETFASQHTREATDLSDAHGVWQKDRGGKYNNYLICELEMAPMTGGSPPTSSAFYDIECELRVVMHNGELNPIVLDRVDRASTPLLRRHLEGANKKLVIIDANPLSGYGIRIGGGHTTMVKVRINELSRKNSRHSRYCVLFRVIGPGSELFAPDQQQLHPPPLVQDEPKQPMLACCSQAMTISSKLIKSSTSGGAAASPTPPTPSPPPPPRPPAPPPATLQEIKSLVDCANDMLNERVQVAARRSASGEENANNSNSSDALSTLHSIANTCSAIQNKVRELLYYTFYPNDPQRREDDDEFANAAAAAAAGGGGARYFDDGAGNEEQDDDDDDEQEEEEEEEDDKAWISEQISLSLDTWPLVPPAPPPPPPST